MIVVLYSLVSVILKVDNNKKRHLVNNNPTLENICTCKDATRHTLSVMILNIVLQIWFIWAIHILRSLSQQILKLYNDGHSLYNLRWYHCCILGAQEISKIVSLYPDRLSVSVLPVLSTIILSLEDTFQPVTFLYSLVQASPTVKP